MVDQSVCGTFHQGYPYIFSQISLGRQCMANCMISTIMAKRLHLSNWTTATLDTILIAGDLLYKETVKNVDNDLLMVSDFGNTIEYGNQTYNLQVINNLYGTIYGTREVMSLQDAVNTMLKHNNWSYGTLCLSGQNARGTSLSLFVHDNECYIFDSHSRNHAGQQIPDGTSVLLHFESVQNMVRYLLQHSRQMNCQLFEITVVNLEEINPQMVSYFQNQQQLKEQYRKTKKQKRQQEELKKEQKQEKLKNQRTKSKKNK